MRRFTNKAIGWKDETVVLTVRVPRPVADELDARVGQEDLPNRSAIVQDAIARWVMLEEQREHRGNGH